MQTAVWDRHFHSGDGFVMERYTRQQVLELYRTALTNSDILGSHYVPELRKLFGDEEWSSMRDAHPRPSSLAGEVVRRVCARDELQLYLRLTETLFRNISVQPLAKQYLKFATNFLDPATIGQALDISYQYSA